MMQNKRYNKIKPIRLCKQKQNLSYKKKEESPKYKLKDIAKPERHTRQNLTYKACQNTRWTPRGTYPRNPVKNIQKNTYTCKKLAQKEQRTKRFIRR